MKYEEEEEEEGKKVSRKGRSGKNREKWGEIGFEQAEKKTKQNSRGERERDRERDRDRERNTEREIERDYQHWLYGFNSVKAPIVFWKIWVVLKRTI